MNPRLVLVAVGLVFSSSVFVAAAQGCLEQVGAWRYGVSNDVAAEGDRGVLANGAVLQVLDLTAPTAPAIVGEVDLADEIDAVALSGTHAFAVEMTRLHVVDLSGPEPIVVGVLDGTRASVIDVEGDFVYLISDTLSIVDVSTPDAPMLRGQVVWDFWQRDIRVESGYAYVIDQDDGLRVVDVSNPDAPTQITVLDLGASTNAERIDVAGGYAYVIGWTWVAGTGAVHELFVVDLTDPTLPVLVTSPTTASSKDIVVRQGVAWLADSSWIHAYDVANPQSPSHLGSSQLGSDFESQELRMATIYGHALVTRDRIGLTVVDLTDPTDPLPVASVDVPAGIEDAATDDGILAIAGLERGVRLVDVSHPAGPTELGFTDLGGAVWGSAIAGDMVYAVGYIPPQANLVVLDISDPGAAVVVGSTPGVPGNWITTGNGYAYVLEQFTGELSVVDLSAPTAPVLVGSLNLGGGPLAHWDWPVVLGDHLVVRDSLQQNAVVVVDVSDPTNPVQITQFDLWTDSSGSGLAGLDPWLLVPDVLIVGPSVVDVVSYDPVVRVFDLSDPTAPVEVAHYFPDGRSIGPVGIAGSVAYLATWDSNRDPPGAIEAVNFANPLEPTFLGLMPRHGDAKRLTFSSDEIFVAHRETGFDTFALCQGPIFADGFETGDTSAWSSAQP